MIKKYHFFSKFTFISAFFSVFLKNADIKVNFEKSCFFTFFFKMIFFLKKGLFSTPKMTQKWAYISRKVKKRCPKNGQKMSFLKGNISFILILIKEK